MNLPNPDSYGDRFGVAKIRESGRKMKPGANLQPYMLAVGADLLQ